MSDRRDEIAMLLAGGEGSPAERAAWEAELSQSPEGRAALALAYEDTAGLAALTAPVEPSSAARDRFTAALGAEGGALRSPGAPQSFTEEAGEWSAREWSGLCDPRDLGIEGGDQQLDIGFKLWDGRAF